MLKRVFSAVMFLLLLTSMLTLAFNIQPVRASGTIYIRADGSIDPPTANITTTDYVTYTFIGNINDSIVVERNNIIVEGAGYAVTGYGYGIDLVNRSDVTIRNATIKRGIWLESSSNSNLSGNNVTDSIDVVRSSNNTIQGNNMTSGGIRLQISSDNNTISGNTIAWTNGFGVEVELESSHNIIVGNNITNSAIGIELDFDSHYDVVSGNIMNGNEVNFDVSGDYPSHSIDVSNLVNGKPVYYLVNQKDLMINPVTYPEIGYLALVNCTNATVESLTLTDQSFPIFETQHSQIANSNMTNVGVQILESSNITIYGNNKTSDNSNKRQGIYVGGSDKITIFKNSLANSWDAIAFESSSDGIVSGNNIVNNTRGISLWDGAENITIYENNLTNNTGSGLCVVGDGASAHVYHNSFTNNAIQVNYIRGYLILDNGYPSGGNCWSDYNGTDLFSGPYQNETGNDGIGDTPYVVDAINFDRYPLMHSQGATGTEMVILPDGNTFYANVTPPGSVFRINVTVSAVTDLATWQLKVTWDPTLLDFSNIILPPDHVFAGQPYIRASDVEIGSVVCGVALGPGGSSFNGTGVLCQIELKILTPPNSSTTTCNLTLADKPVDTFLLDSKLNDISFTTENATFTYVQPQGSTGDLNLDGTVDISDAILASSAFGSYPGHPKWNSQADLNHDNEVDIFDIIILANNFGKH